MQGVVCFVLGNERIDMKEILLFGKGLIRAIKDSWFALMVLLITCIVGVVGVNFCYRTVMFPVRQPEIIADYQGVDCFSYFAAESYSQNTMKLAYFKGDLHSLMSIAEEKFVGVEGRGTFTHNGEELPFNVFTEDYNKENLLTKDDFKESSLKIVLNKYIQAEIGGVFLLEGVSYEVVGKTENATYIPYGNSAGFTGYLWVYTNEQLTRGEMSKFENAIGKTFNRDESWGDKLSVDKITFIILGLIILLVTSINVLKVFRIYIDKNTRRYTIYGMLGMNKLRSSLTILSEGSLFLSVNLTLGLIIDAFIFRPLTKILGISFMYDFTDISITLFMILIPFVSSILIEIFNRLAKSTGNKLITLRKV